MRTTLNLNRHRQARIWLGELPHLIPSSENTKNNGTNCRRHNSREKLFEIEIIYPDSSFSLSNKPQFPPVQRAAVEMIVPSVGRALYGLLGAEFVSDRSGKLLVKVAVSVAVSEDVEPEIDGSLASGIDKVCAGLPVEYADSVFDGVIHAGTILGSGVLSFNCAAHGEIGSSPQMFRQLTLRVVRLIAAASVRESLSEEELAELLAADETDRAVHQLPIKNYVSSLNRNGLAKGKFFWPDNLIQDPLPMG